MYNRRILVDLLKHTKGKNGLSKNDLENGVLDSADIALLIEKGYLSAKEDYFSISPLQKILLSVESIRLGSVIDTVCRYLSWQEFEQIVEYALNQNNFETIHHLRFKIGKRKSEIDVVGVRGESMLGIDCKQWRCGNKRSLLEKAASLQNSRVEALAGNIKFLETKIGKKVSARNAIPVIITLIENPFKIVDGVPIVPILKFHDFLNEFYGYMKSIKLISVCIKINK